MGLPESVVHIRGWRAFLDVAQKHQHAVISHDALQDQVTPAMEGAVIPFLGMGSCGGNTFQRAAGAASAINRSIER